MSREVIVRTAAALREQHPGTVFLFDRLDPAGRLENFLVEGPDIATMRELGIKPSPAGEGVGAVTVGALARAVKAGLQVACVREETRACRRSMM